MYDSAIIIGEDDKPEEILRQAKCWGRPAAVDMCCYRYADLFSALNFRTWKEDIIFSSKKVTI